MTVRKSQAVIDADNVSLVTTDRFGGTLIRAAANSAKGAGDASGDIYPMLRLWTGWVIDSLIFQSETWGAAAVLEIGAYDTAANGGAAIDADAFASAIVASAAIARIDLEAEAATQLPSRVNLKVRDILGLAAGVADKWVDLCITATNVGAAVAATFSTTVRYIEH